jgi:phospholipid/cholesterol/gamma-HCH transport system substrate-binding protein
MTRNPVRSSRLIREGSVGLLALAGLTLFGISILWLQNFNFGQRSYRVIVEFFSVSGLQVGSPARFRGIPVGRVTAIRPGAKSAEIEITISAPNLVIPKAVKVEANQSGLISETTIDFTPLLTTTGSAIASSPLDAKCDRKQIICNGDRLPGEIGVSLDELIRTSVAFADLYSQPQFVASLQKAVKNTSTAAENITTLSQDVSTLTRTLQGELPSLSRSLRTEVSGLSQSLQGEVKTLSSSAKAVEKAANQVDGTISEVNQLIQANRSTLVSTLTNLRDTSSDLKSSVSRLSPILNRVEQGKLLENLETFSANAAQASQDLKALTNTAASPETLATLYQLLDSARATFQNTQKLTSDLDELTGDPQLRQTFRNLLKGLSKLISSTNELEQQTELARLLAYKSEINSTQFLRQPNPSPVNLKTAVPTATPIFQIPPSDDSGISTSE